MSNYEVQVMLGCLDCEYSDKKKLQEMKKYHDKQEWAKCSRVKGSCIYGFKRDIRKNEDGTLTCYGPLIGDDQE